MFRTIWVIINLLTSVLVCSIPIFMFGYFDRTKLIPFKATKIWANWMLLSTGLKYEIIGIENININNQYIFMCNHESALDIILGVKCIPNKIIFLAKKELFKIPIFGWAMKFSGMIKIDRQNSEIAKISVERATQKLIKSKFSTLIYPEGTRSKNGRLLPFKKGGFILAIKSKIPLVPITIIGSGKALPKGKYFIKKEYIKIIINPPILTNEFIYEEKEDLIQNCRNIIKNNIISFNDQDTTKQKIYSA